MRFAVFLATLIVAGWAQGAAWAQLSVLDDYDGAGGLVYQAEDPAQWTVGDGVLRAWTGGVTTPEHSYASWDLSRRMPTWSLDPAN